MRTHVLFFLIPSILLIIGVIINFFLPQKHDAYLLWTGYSLIIYFLAIFGLLTVLTPLSSIIKAGIALALPIIAGFSLLQVVVGSNPVTGGYSAALYVLSPGAVLERVVSKLGHKLQDYRLERSLPDLCRTAIPELLAHKLVHFYVEQVLGQPDGKLLVLQSFEGPRMSDYYTQKTATRLTRLLTDGTEDPDFALNRECVSGNSFTLGPDGRILVSTPWTIGPENPAFLYDSRGTLLRELRPDQETTFSSPFRFSKEGRLYALRTSDPYGENRSLSLVELLVQPKPSARFVRDLAPVLRHGKRPSVIDFLIGPEGDFRIFMEDRSESARGTDFFVALLKPGSDPISYQQLPANLESVVGMFGDGALLLQSGFDTLILLSGSQKTTMNERDWVSKADPDVSDNFSVGLSKIAVLPGDRLAFVSHRRTLATIITDRAGRKVSGFTIGKSRTPGE